MCSLSQYWQSFQQRLFPGIPESTEGVYTERHRELMWVLDLVRLEGFVSASGPALLGRPALDRRPLARAFLAKAVFQLPTTEALRERLHVDRALRQLCGWETRRAVPSAATFSRAFAAFARTGLLDQLHAHLVAQHLGEVLIWHVSRDSTAITARERPQPRPAAGAASGPAAAPVAAPSAAAETAVAPVVAPSAAAETAAAAPVPAAPRRRGRRGRRRSPPDLSASEPTRLARQYAAGPAETERLLDELPRVCDVGGKKNSQGHTEYWTGYKLHADVGDGGIPLLCVTTSASLHDSQVAIPMARKTAQRVRSLYDLMDSAYDAGPIRQASLDLEHVPIIDANRRRGPAPPPMEPDRARRYDARSGSERFNALLKDQYGGRTVRVRGAPKVHTHLMCGVVVIFAAVLQGWAAAS